MILKEKYEFPAPPRSELECLSKGTVLENAFLMVTKWIGGKFIHIVNILSWYIIK